MHWSPTPHTHIQVLFKIIFSEWVELPWTEERVLPQGQLVKLVVPSHSWLPLISLRLCLCYVLIKYKGHFSEEICSC